MRKMPWYCDKDKVLVQIGANNHEALVTVVSRPYYKLIVYTRTVQKGTELVGWFHANKIVHLLERVQ